jgi:glycosyltransferase involved in cell wall biosynthesis
MPPRTPLVFCSCQNLNKKYPIPFNWIEKYAINKAAGWICIGELVAKNLSSRSGYDKLPMAQIPLGVDMTCFRPDPERGKAVLKDLNWTNDGPPIVGYLGRFVPEKGLNVLQSALDEITTPWRALFVGAGPLETELRKWAERYGNRVRICTSVAHGEVPSYLNAMDVLCAPSQTTPAWKEQFGRMIVEAFASGLAFIGSDSGEIPNVVGDAGLIVGEKDSQGWSSAITGLLENATRRHEFAARGLARAHEQFAWAVVARRYLEFFESILAGKN